MKKIFFAVMIITISAMFLSCATSLQRLPLSKESAAKVQGKTCEISNPKTPDFYAQTTGKAWLPPMIGIAASYSAGRELVEQNGIEDPAISVSKGIAKILNENFNIKLMPKQDIITDNNDIDTLCKTYNKSDLLLDVRTMGWAFGTGVGSVPAFSSQYIVSCLISLKFIDVKSKEVMSDEVFIYPNKASVDSNRAFSYEELMDNNAEGLKNELRKASEEAILFFKERTFSL